MATSRVMSRRLIWLGPVDSRTVATWLSLTTRVLPSLPATENGKRSRSCGVLRAPGARRTFTS